MSTELIVMCAIAYGVLVGFAWVLTKAAHDADELFHRALDESYPAHIEFDEAA